MSAPERVSLRLTQALIFARTERILTHSEGAPQSGFAMAAPWLIAFPADVTLEAVESAECGTHRIVSYKGGTV